MTSAWRPLLISPRGELLHQPVRSKIEFHSEHIVWHPIYLKLRLKLISYFTGERQKERKKCSIAHGRARNLAPQPSSHTSSSSLGTLSEPTTNPNSPSSLVQYSGPGRTAGTSPLLPSDPIMNAMQTSEDTIRMALLNNAVCLGFDLDQLANCTTPYMSPFFRSITAQDSPQDLVASTFNTAIPIHLQPTMAQILVPHHASLDLIPMPLLRERAIMMSFAMPDAFNLWDLKLDIYTRRALVCRSHRPGGTCQPWDQKNWEAMPWFLKKWSMTIET
jgi:hypothetical protein